MESNQSIRVVELFAGVGGFHCGLDGKSSDFKTIWANQWEPGRKTQFAFECYDGHFPGIGVNEDINLVMSQVPDHDLLVGGFPCQDYSVAATKAKGIEGRKGVLWWNIRTIVQEHHPPYILLENVDRLVKSPVKQRGRDFGIILRCLNDEGYTVEWRVINAAEYGLQQKRRRVFIFAYRNDTPFASRMSGLPSEDVVSKDGFFAGAFPVTDEIVKGREARYHVVGTDCPDLVAISDSFRATFYNSGVMRDGRIYTRETRPDHVGPSITLRDILETDVDEHYYVSEEQLERWREAKGAKRIERRHRDGTPYIYAEGAVPFPDNLDVPGRTMLTSEGSLNRSSHLVLDPQTGRYRILTPVECERLNGFPDGWTEGMTERQRYFTMGNALVVQLIERMGDRILEIRD